MFPQSLTSILYSPCKHTRNLLNLLKLLLYHVLSPLNLLLQIVILVKWFWNFLNRVRSVYIKMTCDSVLKDSRSPDVNLGDGSSSCYAKVTILVLVVVKWQLPVLTLPVIVLQVIMLRLMFLLSVLIWTVMLIWMLSPKI